MIYLFTIKAYGHFWVGSLYAGNLEWPISWQKNWRKQLFNCASERWVSWECSSLYFWDLLPDPSAHRYGVCDLSSIYSATFMDTTVCVHYLYRDYAIIICYWSIFAFVYILYFVIECNKILLVRSHCICISLKIQTILYFKPSCVLYFSNWCRLVCTVSQEHGRDTLGSSFSRWIEYVFVC